MLATGRITPAPIALLALFRTSSKVTPLTILVPMEIYRWVVDRPNGRLAARERITRVFFVFSNEWDSRL